jgi:hypothetical protein
MGVAPEAIVEKTYFEYRLKDIVAPCLIKRQNSCVSMPFPGSVDRTTIQNIVIIAIASII